MSIQEYINSGMIESCVLGLATEAEYLEFMDICSRNPEAAAARNAFEKSLEEQLSENAIAPPSHLKGEILESLNLPSAGEKQQEVAPASAPVRKMNIWKYIAAASLLLLAGAGFWAYTVNNKYQALLQSALENSNNPDHTSHVEAITELKTIVQKPSVKWSAMLEPATSAHCMAHVYWDTLSKNTFLLLGTIPKPLAGRQFQLWALKNNNPVNLGLFDSKKEGQLIQMKDINNARVFVITLEPQGGSTAPTINSLYARGEL